MKRRFYASVGALVVLLLAWQAIVSFSGIPSYVFPGPGEVLHALRADWGILWPALLFTWGITALALVGAIVLGVGLALLMNQAEWIEAALSPVMVVMQVTPIIAVAPLLILWVNNLTSGLFLCAWLIAFFPIVSNTSAGLRSADPGLEDLFRLYGASRWQIFVRMRLPSALPYFLAGLRISGGLALVGAVAAEFVAGTGGQKSGLAFRILEAGYTMAIPRLFGALALISISGLAIHGLTTALSWACLRKWHTSAIKKESRQ